MKTKYILITAALFFLFISTTYAAEIKVAGTNNAIAKIISPIKDAYEKNTGDTLTILNKHLDSLIALEKGEADMVAIVSLFFDNLISRAHKAGVNINPSTLQRTVVAKTQLLVFINKSNKINSLTKEQLKDIFTGKITNWRDVGGQDLAINVYWGKGTPYVNTLFTNQILDGEKITSQAKLAGDQFDLRTIVTKDQTAIVLGSSGLITPATKAPSMPAIYLPIEVVTKGEPSAKVKKVLTFYKEEFGFMDE